MKTKHLLSLVLAIAALALVSRRFSDEPGGLSASETGRGSAASPERDTETDGEEPASLSRIDEGASDRVTAGSSVLGDFSATPSAGPTRRVEAEIIWPDAARPSGPVEVMCFSRDVSGAEAVRMAMSGRGGERDDSPRERIFLQLDPSRAGHTSAADTLVALALTRRGADGRWIAALDVPEDAGRVFVHALGSTYFTGRSAILDRGAESISLRPSRGARLEITASSADDSIDVGGLEYELSQDQSTATMVAMGQSAMPRFSVSGTLDGDGRAAVEIVPAEMGLSINVEHDGAAPARSRIAPLLAGTTEHLEVTLDAGGAVAGVVIGDDDAPIAGARVAAFTPGRAFGFDDDEIRREESDTAGRFRLVGLPEGPLIVRADASGWLDSGRTTEVEVTADEEHTGLVIKLERGASVAGRVLGPDGAPAAGVEVEALFDVAHMFGPSSLNATRGIHGSATTLGDGSFEISGLGRGPFSIRARRESSEEGQPGETARLDGIQPGAEGITLSLASPVDVRGVLRDDLGEIVSGLEVRCSRLASGAMGDLRLGERRARSAEGGIFAFDLPSGTWELSVMEETHVTAAPVVLTIPGANEALELVCVRAATVSGRVLDPGGAPVEGASVFYDADTGQVVTALLSAPSPDATRSGADGAFTLLGLPPGELTITASHDEFARASASQLVAGPGEQLSDLVLRLSQGGSIEGICFDDEGRTASDRVVTVQSMTMTNQRVAASDSDGTFRIDGLEAGNYQVVAIDPAMRTSGDADTSSINDMFKYMELATAEVVEGEVATVFLGAPPSDPVEVSGRVTQGGEPYAQAMVNWLPASTGVQEKMKFTATDADGRYSLTLDEAGDYVISVAKLPGGDTQQITVEFEERVEEGTETLRRDIEIPGGSLAGRVLDADGEPLGAARVSVIEVGGVRTNQLIGGSYAELQTDADGRFEVSGLRAGVYQASAGGAMLLGSAPSAPARVTVGPIELGEDARFEGIEIRLTPACSAEVVVRDGAGQPVQGASVFLRDGEGRHTELFSMSATGPAGRATLHGLAEGTYTVTARTDRMASVESAPFRVVPGETGQVELVAEEGTTVVAVCKGRSDDPIPSARVQLLDDQGRDVSRRIGLADVQNLYQTAAFDLAERRMGPYPPGQYVLVAESDDGRRAKKKFRINPGGGERRVTLRLR
ncbi:MAG: carboxypeptidase regulatory-like domain-containing protein [Planctomycetota bacterium]|nr:carboxypeptidase regulatory-like domain-containing protein [Planctomycetota bacterium]